jgi:predicted RNA binding protein YcfA (HicA-like mRNA interferase family)
VKVISGKRMCRVLERHGWTLLRIRGSHHLYENEANDPPQVVVPVHGNKDLKPGIQKSIMKDAGLSEGDL